MADKWPIADRSPDPKANFSFFIGGPEGAEIMWPTARRKSWVSAPSHMLLLS